MLSHESDLTEKEKRRIDALLDDINDDENEPLPDEFDEEEGCTPPKGTDA